MFSEQHLSLCLIIKCRALTHCSLYKCEALSSSKLSKEIRHGFIILLSLIWHKFWLSAHLNSYIHHYECLGVEFGWCPVICHMLPALTPASILVEGQVTVDGRKIWQILMPSAHKPSFTDWFQRFFKINNFKKRGPFLI